MKNIYVLPTDKSSILSIEDGILILHRPQWRKGTQNIYITSDEEIKEGDWFLEKAGRQYPIQWNGIEKLNFHCKKIILTTDELYIHNDLVPKEYNPSPQYVQRIDDEFLEWFVKNPSCEFVEVKNGVKRLNSDGEEIGFPDMSSYKIIIPKEEVLLQSSIDGESIRGKAIKQDAIDTLEYGLLQHIKMCLECNNESQAVRLLEKYGFEKQEELYDEKEVELIANEMVNWAIDNVGNPNPQSGRKFDEVIAKFKKK